MKKLIIFGVFLLTFFGCQNETKVNNPAFEAEKDNVFWKAPTSKVTISQGSFVISAYTGNEVLTITLPSGSPIAYSIGPGSSVRVSYTYTNGNIVKHYDADATKGDGEIVLKAENESGKYTGNFRFNLEDDNGNTLNFNKGTFYKIQKQ